MNYLYHDQQSEQTLILLHGTGGSADDLLPVARYIAPKANYLSFEGDVLENGQRRFFKRHSEGDYDIEDLNQRGTALAILIKTISHEKHIDLEKTIIVGYSNGANIGINLLLNPDLPVNKGILLHPMYPVDVDDTLDLTDVSVLATLGKADPIVSVEESHRVRDLFKERGATWEEVWVQGHRLEHAELVAAKEWLKQL